MLTIIYQYVIWCGWHHHQWSANAVVIIVCIKKPGKVYSCLKKFWNVKKIFHVKIKKNISKLSGSMPSNYHWLADQDR